MKKKLTVLAIITGLMLSALAGCSTRAASGTEEEPLVLKLGHIQSEMDLWHDGAKKFKEEVEKNSNGTIEVQLFPSSTLGGDRDMTEGMMLGTVDFALIAGVLGNFEPSIQLLELPYLFESQGEFDKVINGEAGAEIKDRVLESADIRILNFWERGPRHITSHKQINSLEDIQGLKIRIPEIKAMEVTWNAMGASPTTMSWNDVYTGLEQNVIEAQENPIPFAYAGGIHEVQEYLAMTAHKYEYVTFSMSDKTWQKLNEEQRQIVEEAAQTATEYENSLVEDNTNVLLEEMKDSGIEVTYPDTVEFAEAAKKAHEDFAATIDLDLYNQIVEEIENE